MSCCSIVAAAILVPIVYAVLGGFKTNGQLAANPVALLPDPWVFTNYTDVLVGWADDVPVLPRDVGQAASLPPLQIGKLAACPTREREP